MGYLSEHHEPNAPRPAERGWPQPGQRVGWRSVVWLIPAAVTVSALTAAGMIGMAAVSGTLRGTVLGGMAAGLATATAWWFALRARAARRTRVGSRVGDRAANSRHDPPLIIARPVGVLIILAASLTVSLTWLLPGAGMARSDAASVHSIRPSSWLLRPDGSRLAVHVTRAKAPTQPPLVVLHGGPGTADMAHDVPALAPLATQRDVYVYDRAGTGASTRLADPHAYTIERAAADLEALRTEIGAARIALHGHSWGARIAVAYAQQHPGRIAALVLSAPDDLPVDGGPMVPGDLTTRLDHTQRIGLYWRLARPRNLFTYALTAADARVAHWMAGDREMDARFAAIYRHTTPALFCDQRLAGRVGTNGVGYYAHYMPQLHPDAADGAVDLSRLAQVRAPVLLIKPACDYVRWSTAGYRRAFPHVRLVMITDAGHTAYLEQPTIYVELVDAFLDGRELPLPNINGDAVPDGYRGTR